MEIKPHVIKIVMTSESNGVINSRTTHEEFAGSPEELVQKNMVFAADTVAGVFSAVDKLSAPMRAVPFNQK